MDAVSLDRFGDILHPMIAQIFEGQGQLVLCLVEDILGNANTAGICETFKAGGDVYTFTKDIAALDDDVADVDAYAKPDLLILRHLHISVCHTTLNGGSALQGVQHTGELDDSAVSLQPDDAAVVFSDFRGDKLFEVSAERRMSSRLISLHEAAVADNVGCKYGG